MEVERVGDRKQEQNDDTAEKNEELMEKIGFVHADNHEDRTTEQLERHLGHCGKLTYVELYGLISASMEGPKVLRNASVRLLMKTLEFVARTVFCSAQNIFLLLEHEVVLFLACVVVVVRGSCIFSSLISSDVLTCNTSRFSLVPKHMQMHVIISCML